MSTRALGASALALALSLALSSCGIIRDLNTDTNEQSSQDSSQDVQTSTQELPFLRQSRMFVEDGNDVAFEISIETLESNGEYVMLDFSHNVLEPMPGQVTMATAPIRLIDPISGQVLRVMDNDAHGEAYGTYFVEGDPYMPTHEGLATTYRSYFPAPSEDVDRLTFTGAGIGHVPGIPLTYVEEFTQAPEPNAYDYIDPETWSQAQEMPEEIWYPERRPEPGLDTEPYAQSMESFVDSPTASTTRAGDEEVIALHADNMFEFDESEPTAEATTTIQEAAQSLRENLGEGVEITIIGHTDGKGADDYNQTLSEERAEAVRELLQEELGPGFTLATQGRGSDELLAREGGEDDEQARARNRRVEFSYQVPMAETDSQEGPAGLEAAKRHVGPPADYFDFADMDVFTTAVHNDVDLNVYPMVRDGAYLFQMVGFQNSTLAELEADLDGDESVLPGSPQQYTEGSMGGFRLEEPGNGLIRYVIRIRTDQDDYEDFADEIFTLVPGEEYLALAVFPAPAPQVQEMTLHAGAFGEIPGVPIH